jgi:hypothetical protein
MRLKQAHDGYAYDSDEDIARGEIGDAATANLL